jgi:hypothetical protein
VKHLDGDVAIESRVASPVHLAHPTGVQPSQDLVRPDASTNHEPPSADAPSPTAR